MTWTSSLRGTRNAGTLHSAASYPDFTLGYHHSRSLAESSLNILPTVTIREGARVKVYLSNDLLLPDYAHHQMPSDL
jgi:type IV secretory pathway VirB10-like protein